MSPAGDHAAAHYLLAVLAARQGEPDVAKSYFQQCLAEAPPTEAHVRTWSNIYLARIFDLEQNREQAVSHYRAALATADTPGARSIAQHGLQQAFVAKRHDR
jgi:tetratricopeptide (TPR) repeat protein